MSVSSPPPGSERDLVRRFLHSVYAAARLKIPKYKDSELLEHFWLHAETKRPILIRTDCVHGHIAVVDMAVRQSSSTLLALQGTIRVVEIDDTVRLRS